MLVKMCTCLALYQMLSVCFGMRLNFDMSLTCENFQLNAYYKQNTYTAAPFTPSVVSLLILFSLPFIRFTLLGELVSFYRWQDNDIKIQFLFKQCHKFLLSLSYICICRNFVFLIGSFETDLSVKLSNQIVIWIVFQMSADALRHYNKITRILFHASPSFSSQNE